MRRRLAVIWALVLFFAFGARAGVWKEGKTLHIGHRGARALVDENTLESLLKAIELGVDMVEFDIQRTKDGVYVLMHDPTVDRTTNGTGRVDEMTLEEFKKLKTKSGYTPPTLEEVFKALKPYDVGMILDIKVKDPNCIPEIYELVEKYGLDDRVIYESSYPKVAKAIEKFNPELISSIYPAIPHLALLYAQAYHLDSISLFWPSATPLYVKIAQKQGYKVMVWTVNKKKWIKWFGNKLKVDGIMTDDPNLFKH